MAVNRTANGGRRGITHLADGNARGRAASVLPVLNWEAIARAHVHPMRLAILEHVLSVPPPDGDPAWSGKTLASALGVPLSEMSYHVRTLRDAGLLAVAGRRQVRGAMQTFYRLSAEAIST